MRTLTRSQRSALRFLSDAKGGWLRFNTAFLLVPRHRQVYNALCRQGLVRAGRDRWFIMSSGRELLRALDREEARS